MAVPDDLYFPRFQSLPSRLPPPVSPECEITVEGCISLCQALPLNFSLKCLRIRNFNSERGVCSNCCACALSISCVNVCILPLSHLPSLSLSPTYPPTHTYLRTYTHFLTDTVLLWKAINALESGLRDNSTILELDLEGLFVFDLPGFPVSNSFRMHVVKRLWRSESPWASSSLPYELKLPPLILQTTSSTPLKLPPWAYYFPDTLLSETSVSLVCHP